MRQHEWFRVSLLLLVLCLLAGGSYALWAASNGTVSFAAAPAAGAPTATMTPPGAVAARVPDVPQYLPQGYDSQAQYQAWWASACGPATLTALLLAYGAKTRIGIILDLLIKTGGIDPGGLHGPHAFIPVIKGYYGGLQVLPFGQREAGLSFAHLRRIVAAGIPVAVDVWDPQGTYFPLQPGHWLVVVKITADHVLVRDSSTLHLDNRLTSAVFQKIYTHVAAVVLPSGGEVPA